ncbi:MAG: FAD-dependent oxidoreductase [Candidatus Andersenbacteria bacterium]|nr:FAD-dependent oxidoreductase [Candidatus Andersenbacteria bacterium]
MSTVFDVAIVGYGPAGITAAIYAARKRLSVVLIGELPGGEVVNSGEIENWTGDGHTDGLALAKKMVGHLDLHTDQVTVDQDLVAKVARGSGRQFEITTRSDKTYMAKTVIYTAGRHPRPLGIPGESEYKNKGVTYCATCDAPLFSGKDVAVIGGGNTGAEAVIMLQKIAKKIYFIHLEDQLRADPILVENFKNDPKVEIILNAKTTKVSGSMMVEGLTFEDTKTKATRDLKVQGVFVAIGAIPNTEPVKDLIPLDTFGAIEADRYGKTALDGFFAAGDVTNIRDAQIVVAAGHGCSAALSAGDYLSRLAGS